MIAEDETCDPPLTSTRTHTHTHTLYPPTLLHTCTRSFTHRNRHKHTRWHAVGEGGLRSPVDKTLWSTGALAVSPLQPLLYSTHEYDDDVGRSLVLDEMGMRAALFAVWCEREL